MPAITGLHHAALTVADLDRSTRWYQEVLGVEVVLREPLGRRAVVMRFPDSGPVLGLVEHADHHDDSFDPARIGLDTLAFTVGSRADLEAFAEQMTARGVEHSGVAEIPPGAVLNFKDPDRIALTLFWDRPTSIETGGAA